MNLRIAKRILASNGFAMGKLVQLGLANETNSRGTAYISQEELAKACAVSVSTVYRVLGEMVETEQLKKTGNGRYQWSPYWLASDEVAEPNRAD